MRFKIHREGRVIVTVATIVASVAVFFLLRGESALWKWLLSAAILLVYSIIIRFFRNPERELNRDPDTIYSPADGTVVVIEQTEDKMDIITALSGSGRDGLYGGPCQRADGQGRAPSGLYPEAGVFCDEFRLDPSGF